MTHFGEFYSFTVCFFDFPKNPEGALIFGDFNRKGGPFWGLICGGLGGTVGGFN